MRSLPSGLKQVAPVCSSTSSCSSRYGECSKRHSNLPVSVSNMIAAGRKSLSIGAKFDMTNDTGVGKGVI